MSVVATRKCVQHATREAVARCPSCGGNFCAECVVEHDGRLLCTRCLAREKVIVPAAPRRAWWSRFKNLVATAVCVVGLWVVFYVVGSWLKLIPTHVHDGSVWREIDGGDAP